MKLTLLTYLGDSEKTDLVVCIKAVVTLRLWCCPLGHRRQSGSVAQKEKRAEMASNKEVAVRNGNAVAEPETIELLTVWEVAGRFDSGIPNGTFRNWIDDPEVQTPPPAFTHRNTVYWTTDSLPQWKVLVDNEIERLKNESWTKAELGEYVLDYVKRAHSQCVNSYPRARGFYSRTEAKKALEQARGMWKFVFNLGESVGIDPETRQRIVRLLHDAEQSLSN